MQAIAKLSDDVAMLSAKLDAHIAHTEREFAKVRQEMATEFKAVRKEMATEFKAVRKEMKAGFKIQLEIIKEVQQSFNDPFIELQTSHRSTKKNHNRRLGVIEKKLGLV